MDDPAKVLIALSLFGSVAYSIGAIARAAVAHRKDETQLDRESAPPLAEARVAGIEQTTRLPPGLSQRGLSANTPI